MEKYDHFLCYFLAWVAFIFFMLFFDMGDWWFALALLMAFLLINPDIDHFFKDHRNFITHSALYPIIIYWVFHPYWNMVTAKELGIILFYPVLIHLMCDFYELWKKLQGYALISCFGKKMTDTQSKGYVLANILGIALYMIYVI